MHIQQPSYHLGSLQKPWDSLKDELFLPRKYWVVCETVARGKLLWIQSALIKELIRTKQNQKAKAILYLTSIFHQLELSVRRDESNCPTYIHTYIHTIYCYLLSGVKTSETFRCRTSPIERNGETCSHQCQLPLYKTQEGKLLNYIAFFQFWGMERLIVSLSLFLQVL